MRKKKFAFGLLILLLLLFSFILVAVTDRKKTTTKVLYESHIADIDISPEREVYKTGYREIVANQRFAAHNKCPIQANLLRPSGPVVALASFPGSGNTWLRYSLEQFTGVLTGSLYNDSVLKKELRGEGIHDGSVSLIKTHGLSDNKKLFHFDPEFNVSYDKAVILIRHPKDGIVSEVNRRYTEPGHTGNIDKERWKRRVVQAYMLTLLKKYSKFILHWFIAFPGPKLVVTYENLKLDLFGEINKIARFLQLPRSSEGIQCLKQNRDGEFKRNSANWEPYISPEVVEALETANIRTKTILEEHNISYMNQT